MIKSDEMSLKNSQIKTVVFEIATGCQYMHDNLVVHRDIKPDNILLGNDLCIKIADFGLAVVLANPAEKLYTFCGTPKYQAPEMLAEQGYSVGVDIWAIGCITYRLFYGNAPFDGISTEEIFRATLRKSAKYCRISKHNQPIENHEIRMMKALMQKDPSKRITLKQLLEDYKFFQLIRSNQESRTSVEKKCHIMLDCIKAIAHFDSNKRIRLNYSPYHDLGLAPRHWIQQWIDISLYGFGYAFQTNIFGFNFKDKSKMMSTPKMIFYCDSNNELSTFELPLCPDRLWKKFAILQKAKTLLHCDQSTSVAEPSESSLPWLQKWIETLDAIVLEFATRLIQINFNRNNKNILFDPETNSITIINNNTRKLLCLRLDFILQDHVTEKMQEYVNVALQYINLLRIKNLQT